MDMPSPHDHINNNTLFTALQQASGLAPASEQSSTASQHNTMSAQSNLDGSHQPHPSATSSTLAGAESTQPATSPTSPLSSSTPSGSNATTSAGSLPCQASTCPTRISAAHSHQAMVGHPGSSHDAQVWASGSGIVAKPRLHLDEGKFVWVDAGYGYSSYTVGLYSNTAVAKSRDLHYFNYSLSHIHVKAEHGIAYLKNCFQCLMGFRGNLYQEEDHEKAAHMVQACIIAHTFASHYDQPDEVAEYLKASENLSEAEVLETTSGMEAYQQATEDARIQQRENQQQYEQEQAAAMEGMSQNQVQKFRQEKALDLREEMLTALFASHGCPFEDTTAESQRMGMTTLAFTEWQERQN
ncbi:hypothetical protein NDA10_007817 [Ustilago hordei]|nr:hypothetical protein NDA10_007817 [Ustilago hordei]UTT93431.1 hypothetical protein NDA17_003139 [Ustilago hordei]